MPEQLTNTKRIDELIRVLRNGTPTEQELMEAADKLQQMRNDMLQLQRVLNMLEEGLKP